MSEVDRLSFLESRDGLLATIDFAHRTIKLYRKAVLTSRKRGFSKPHFASIPEYRKKYIQSYLILKNYITKNIGMI